MGKVFEELYPPSPQEPSGVLESFMHWQVDPPTPQLVNHTTDLVIFQEDDPLSFPAVDGPMYCISPSPDGDIYNTIIDNGMNADAQILCSISALFLPSYKV